MASVLLKRCTSCKEYTLQDACPRCGAQAKPNRPAKFSPEDHYGDYRRKLKRLDTAKGPGNSDSERVAGAQPAAPAPTADSADPAGPSPKAAGRAGSPGLPDRGARQATKGKGA